MADAKKKQPSKTRKIEDLPKRRPKTEVTDEHAAKVKGGDGGSTGGGSLTTPSQPVTPTGP
jgi:hypothetical protein